MIQKIKVLYCIRKSKPGVISARKTTARILFAAIIASISTERMNNKVCCDDYQQIGRREIGVDCEHFDRTEEGIITFSSEITAASYGKRKGDTRNE